MKSLPIYYYQFMLIMQAENQIRPKDLLMQVLGPYLCYEFATTV
jgi:hypothetical protein